jgi:hypothetical protein
MRIPIWISFGHRNSWIPSVVEACRLSQPLAKIAIYLLAIFTSHTPKITKKCAIFATIGDFCKGSRSGSHRSDFYRVILIFRGMGAEVAGESVLKLTFYH